MAPRSRGAERREAHLAVCRTWRGAVAPLAKGARLSALHRGFFGLRGALLVRPYHLSVSERVAPGHDAEGPSRSRPSAWLRATPAGPPLAPSGERLRKTPLDEQGGSSLCIV